MRKHGHVASAKARAIALEAEKEIVLSMWEARVLREARRGAVVVAGPRGEVLRVVSVSIDGKSAHAAITPLAVPDDVLKRVGPNWIEDDLKIKNNLGDDQSQSRHSTHGSPPPAAPIPAAGHRVDLRTTRPS